MKLKKYKNIIINIIIWFLLALCLSLIYLFRKERVAIIILSVIIIFLFFLWAYISGSQRKKISQERKKISQINHDKLIKFVEKYPNFEINDRGYNKLVLYKNQTVLETINWNRFTPRSGNKRGITLGSYIEIERYLKTILSKKK